jgi:hypothetical protein
MIRSIVVLTLLMALPAVRADAGCWAPDHAERLPPGVAATVPPLWQKELAAIGAMMKRLPALLRLDDARQRVNTFIGHSAVPGGGNLVTIRGTLYPRNTWVGECGLTAGPEFFNSGFLYVGFNQVSDIFATRAVAVKGDGLTAYLEPQVTERVQGEPLYDAGMVVLTPPGVTPWAPVSVDEYLAFKGRELDAAVASAQETLTRTSEGTFDKARGDRTVAEMQKTDPKAAAELRKVLDQTARDFEEGKKAAFAEAQKTRDHARENTAAFKAALARLTPEERRAQARVGSGPYGLAPAGQNGRGALVKLNPALSDPALLKRRVHLIVVSFTANNQKFVPDLRQALKELDLGTIRLMIQ